MTVTTPLSENLRVAARYETENRWAQAAAAYEAALVTLRHTSEPVFDHDRELLRQMHQSAANRSREMTSLPQTAITERQKHLMDLIDLTLALRRRPRAG
jgi:hypothetical protein